MSLDLFSEQQSGSGFTNSYDVETPPANPIQQNNPIRFVLQGHPEHYLDMSNTYMRVKMKVVKEDGSSIPQDAKVAPVNEMFDAMYDSVQVKLNQQLVGGYSQFYPHLSYMRYLLSFSDTARYTFYKATVGLSREPENHTFALHGYSKYVAGSKEVTYFGRLACNALTTPRLVLPHVSLEILINRTTPEFCLVKDVGDPERYQVKLIDATLVTRRVAVDEYNHARIMSQLARAPAIYPYCHTRADTIEINQGIFNGIL